MDPHDAIESAQLDALSQVFADQLQDCIEECAHGRRGLFSDLQLTIDDEREREWPEAVRLRELALALQSCA